MGSARSALGETLNRADAVEVRLSEQALMAASDRSAAEDLDMVQALSEFQNQQTGYDAALKAYSMVQRLSLFDYVSG
jgi:flagellar hook-associated protein 3 FlgL